jgi:small subunit ribosomal protein S20
MIKTQIKNLESALGNGEATKAQDQLKVLTRKLDKLSTTSTLHKNTAARMKSRMTRRVNALASKTAG